MKSVRSFTLTIFASLALSACSGNPADEAAAVDESAPLDGSAAVDTGEASDVLQPDNQVFDASPDETIAGSTPETGGTEPMDSAQPMDGTAPMTEGFGPGESTPSG